MNKTDKIENLTDDKFKEVLKTILSVEGFSEITDCESALYATLVNPLSPTKTLFLLFPFRLSGDVDFQSVNNRIVQSLQKIAINAITIVSKYHISNGFKSSIRQFNVNVTMNYLDRDDIIKLVDKDYPNLWKHDNQNLLRYEESYEKNVKQENDLKRLKLPDEKCQKLLDIYITPQLRSYEEDPNTHTVIRKHNDINTLLSDKESIILCGESGAGKSTLLKHLGGLLIKRNEDVELSRKNLPIYVTALNIHKHNYDLSATLVDILSPFFQFTELEEVFSEYSITILVDSIDEFEDVVQKGIFKTLKKWEEQHHIRFFIGTREQDQLEKKCPSKNVKSIEISRFNFEQIKRFVSAFFSDNHSKVNNLLEALRENKIIERLPITPLTLSLISILYDETDFEIPATITDIYDNFNALIIGKAVVSSKVEFIDISFKERILSIYGLLLMRKKDHSPLTNDEFLEHFRSYFEGKTLPIKDAALEDVLNYLIHNTGILYLKDGRWVAFSHDSYMEYYAAVEIFKFRRDLESELIEHFTDIQWQNVAIFYAGKTKDMPDFAKNINNRLRRCNKICDYIAGIQGCGYLLQALYQTDNKIRKDLVLTALDLLLESNDVLKKLASDDRTLFRNYRIPIILLVNFIHFYEMFNSITLKVPLQLSFEDLVCELDRVCGSINSNKSIIPGLGYKLLELAFTLDSKRINDATALDSILFRPEIIKDASLNMLACFVLDMFNKTRYKELRRDLKKKFSSLDENCSLLQRSQVSKIRFSLMDTIVPNRRVRIFVEGKTDAEILEHAYMSPLPKVAAHAED